MSDNNDLRIQRMVSGISDDTLDVHLNYPGLIGECTYIQIGLMHVRAADDLRISYDFDRNGWKIEQLNMRHDDEDADPEWQETAFLPVYPFEKD